MSQYEIDEKTKQVVEAALAKLKWRDVVAIDKVIAEDKRSEVIPLKEGIRVIKIKRETVNDRNV